MRNAAKHRGASCDDSPNHHNCVRKLPMEDASGLPVHARGTGRWCGMHPWTCPPCNKLGCSPAREALHLVPFTAAALTTRASANSQKGCQRADAIHSLVSACGSPSAAGADASTSLCVMMSGSMGRSATSSRSAYRPTVELWVAYDVTKHKRPCI